METELPIFSTAPQTWVELQQLASLILSDCGYSTEVEKKIEAVRGHVAVDVYAVKEEGHRHVIFCECKYWEANIPQTVIHSFRTVISDYGANQGFLIAKNGFQSGAYEAAKKSNVSLLNWQEFQDAFKMEWLKMMVQKNETAGKELRNFINYLFSKGQSLGLPVNERLDALQALRGEHHDWLFYSFKDHYCHFNTGVISLEDTIRAINSAKRDMKIDVSDLREYFCAIYKGCKDAVVKIEALFDNKISWDPVTMLLF